MRRAKRPGDYLTKREQEIMELLQQRKRMTAAEIVAALPGDASNSTVRTLLRILEGKGHVDHEEVNGRFIFVARHPASGDAQNALRRVLRFFFGGSSVAVAATLINEVSPDELEAIRAMIEQKRARLAQPRSTESVHNLTEEK